MKIDVKKLLLTGTAIVAVSAFASQAQAADELVIDTNESGTFTTTGPDETADSAFNWQTNVNALSSQSKNVRVDNTATITLDNGDIIGSSTSGTAIIAGATGKTLTLDDATTDDAAASVTINGDISVGSFAAMNLTITGNDQDATADTLAIDVNGDINLGTGTLTIDTDTNAGNTVALNLSGDLTATAVVLDDDGAPITVTFDGTSAQSITGTINGDTDADGTLVIANAAGVTFNSAIGGTQAMNLITISKTGADSAATFKGNVAATAIVLGDGAGTGTNTATFNSTGGNLTVAGTVNGTAGDTDVLALTGGANKTTFSGVIGGVSAIDSLTIATGTTGAFDANVSATAITLTGTGTFEKTSDGDTVTGNINGASAGSGTLNVDGNTTWVGSIGNTNRLGTISVAAGKVLTLDAAAVAADRTIDATTIQLDGAASGLTLTSGANNITVARAITTGVNGEGVITITDATDDNNVILFSGDLGTSALKLDSLVTAGGGNNVETIRTANDLFVDAISLDGSDVLDLRADGDQVVSGTIDGNGGASEGQVVVGTGTTATNVTFQGVIGGTQTIDLMDINTGATANFSKNVSVTTSGAAVVGLDMDGTMNVSTADNTVAISVATGDIDIDGTVDITGDNSATVTAASDLLIDGNLSTILSGTAKTLTLTSTGNNIVLGATSDTTVTAGNQIITGGTGLAIGAAGRTTTLNIVRTADFDPTTVAGVDAVIDADTNNTVVTVENTTGVFKVGVGSGGIGFDDGDVINVIEGGATNATTSYATQLGSGRIVLVDSGLIDLQDNASDASTLSVKVVVQDAAGVLLSENGVGAANALMDIASADIDTEEPELAEARGNLMAAGSAEEATEVAESLAPTVDGGAMGAALNVSANVMGVTSTRLAALRSGTAETGMSAGNSANGVRGWIQGFGTTASQDRRDGVDGYDADTVGVAVGADGEMAMGGHVGAALSYAATDVDSKNAANTETDVDSYQVTLYGDMPLDSNGMYLDGMVAYAWNDVESTRYNVGGIGLNAFGDYDADQFSAYAEIGRDFAQEGGLTLTPYGLAHWTHYSPDSYTETGAGGAGLVVDPDSVNVFELGVGVDATWDVQNADGSRLQPQLTAAYRYDLVGDDVSATGRFIGAGAAFDTDGLEPSQHTLNLGGALKYMTTDNWELSAEYDFEYKADYDAHSGQLRAAYHF